MRSALRLWVVVPTVALASCIPGGVDRPATPASTGLPATAAPPPIVVAQPTPAPAWEARPVRPDARTVRAQEVVVRSGDTLSAIAQTTGSSLSILARANGLGPPYRLSVGQRLSVPGGRFHRVRAGETGIAIARAYDVAWSEVVALNELTEPYALQSGTLLRLPGGAEPTRVAAQSESAPTIGDILTGGEPATVTLALPDHFPRRRLSAARAAVVPVVEPARFTGRFAAPVAAPVSQRFGAMGSGQVNQGVNFAVPVGTSVASAADGVVVFAAPGPGGYGGLVLIKHGDGYASAYGHLSALEVTRGQRVLRGAVVGRSGRSAMAERPFLHFEIRRGATPVDPLPLIAVR